MQFFHLFSFVVVASYAAALPQPAELSEKYSNDVDTNSAFGLEARSYQPVLNSYKDSATSVLLKRQDDSEGSPEANSEVSPETNSEGSPETNSEGSPEANSEGSPETNSEGSPEANSEGSPETNSEGSPENDSEESTEDDDGSEHTETNLDTPLDEAELGSLLLSSTIEEAGEDYVEVPESVKTAAAAVGGSVEKELVEYLKKALYVGTTLKEWEEGAGKNAVLVIQSGLGDEEYAKVEPSLKEAGEKLTTDASGYMKEMTDAVLAIEKTPGSVKQEMETIHAAVGRTLDAYKAYFEVLQPQLTKFDAGANINQYLSEASASFVGFSSSQQGLYDGILQKLETAPSE
ncbi:hypothetical protein BASA50_003164 [Batrachochytrium salamandrivorans]|uniref:Uncharacterized protein n=1 Tax=Batrachochytrium salamandrivorans TaxID=1357716 RepID=A0ABQ8FJ88_9FUNG|nr:hypothetical protein BASA50_003164 [Batrachochytrium salamandrivorans]KAH9253818.1 hypothetical protein BASA81_008254 [Batrachochytrium salamandrivorans]